MTAEILAATEHLVLRRMTIAQRTPAGLSPEDRHRTSRCLS